MFRIFNTKTVNLQSLNNQFYKNAPYDLKSQHTNYSESNYLYTDINQFLRTWTEFCGFSFLQVFFSKNSTYPTSQKPRDVKSRPFESRRVCMYHIWYFKCFDTHQQADPCIGTIQQAVRNPFHIYFRTRRKWSIYSSAHRP